MLREKSELMQELGKKQLRLTLANPLQEIPETLKQFDTHLSEDGLILTHTFSSTGKHSDVNEFIDAIKDSGLSYSDINTQQSSLEDIFVQLVSEKEQ